MLQASLINLTNKSGTYIGHILHLAIMKLEPSDDNVFMLSNEEEKCMP